MSSQGARSAPWRRTLSIGSKPCASRNRLDCFVRRFSPGLATLLFSLRVRLGGRGNPSEILVVALRSASECDQPDIARTRAIGDMLTRINLAGAHAGDQSMKRIGIYFADTTDRNPTAAVNTSFRGEKTRVSEGDGLVRAVGCGSFQRLGCRLIDERG